MNFTYLYKDDPDMDALYGNITWMVPNVENDAHWIHAEYICESIFRFVVYSMLKVVYQKVENDFP